jgi:hypothetical protein
MENRLSGSVMSEHVEDTEVDAEVGVVDSLGIANDSLVLATDSVLMSVVVVLQTLNYVSVSAHHITV